MLCDVIGRIFTRLRKHETIYDVGVLQPSSADNAADKMAKVTIDNQEEQVQTRRPKEQKKAMSDTEINDGLRKFGLVTL